MLPLTKFGRLLMDGMMVCVVADTQFVGKDGTLRTYGLNAFLDAHFWDARDGFWFVTWSLLHIPNLIPGN